MAALCFGSTLQAEPIRIAQSNGEPLELDQPARRIITLAPSLAEMVYAAGAGDTLIATVEWSDFPEPVNKLPRIGDAFRFDLERILTLKPDLVMAWESGNPASAVARIEELGLAVWRSEVRQVQDIATDLRTIGRITGHQETADAAADEFLGRLARLREDHRDKTPMSFFYQVARQPLYTVNGDHLISQGLNLCSANNVFADLGNLAPQVSPESVILKNPDVLVAGQIPGNPDPLEHWNTWPRMAAVANGRTVLLPADETTRATPRILDSMEIACTLFDQIRVEAATTP